MAIPFLILMPHNRLTRVPVQVFTAYIYMHFRLYFLAIQYQYIILNVCQYRMVDVPIHALHFTFYAGITFCSGLYKTSCKQTPNDYTCQSTSTRLELLTSKYVSISSQYYLAYQYYMVYQKSNTINFPAHPLPSSYHSNRNFMVRFASVSTMTNCNQFPVKYKRKCSHVLAFYLFCYAPICIRGEQFNMGGGGNC